MNLIIVLCTLSIPILVRSSGRHRQHERMLDGIKVSIEGHEYMAAVLVPKLHRLSRRRGPTMSLKCSAVIITRYYILTTATCMKKVNVTTGVIRSNSSNWHSKRSPYSDHRIHQVYYHPASEFKDYDVALVQVDPPFYGVNEKPISLINDYPRVKTYIESYGWGRVAPFEGGPKLCRYSFGLRGIPSRVIASAKCATKLSGDIRVKRKNKLLCSYEAEIGGCDRYEGGPLIMDGKLAGILTYPGCGRDVSVHSPPVLVDRWLRKHIGNLEASAQEENRQFRHQRTVLSQNPMVRGVRSNVSQHGFAVAIILRNKSDRRRKYKLQCSATIISETHALTAASCVQNQDISQLILRGNTTLWEDDKNSYDHKVESISFHPSFVTGSVDNNLAVIVVDSYTKFNGKQERVAKISKKPMINKEALFGDTSRWTWIDTFKGAQTLKPLLERSLRAQRILDDKCEKQISKVVGVNSKTQICIGRDPNSPCNGDEGSPLFHSHRLLGIASYVGCGRTPSLYMKIESYRNWIASITNDKRHLVLQGIARQAVEPQGIVLQGILPQGVVPQAIVMQAIIQQGIASSIKNYAFVGYSADPDSSDSSSSDISDESNSSHISDNDSSSSESDSDDKIISHNSNIQNSGI